MCFSLAKLTKVLMMHNILATCSVAMTIVTLKIDIFYSIPNSLSLSLSLSLYVCVCVCVCVYVCMVGGKWINDGVIWSGGSVVMF